MITLNSIPWEPLDNTLVIRIAPIYMNIYDIFKSQHPRALLRRKIGGQFPENHCIAPFPTVRTSSQTSRRWRKNLADRKEASKAAGAQ